jgi:hypothetical protein
VLLPEDGPPCWYLVPALDHEGVHAAGTVLGTGQQLPGPVYTNQKLDYTNQKLDYTNQKLDYTNQKLGYNKLKAMVMFYKQKLKASSLIIN